MTCGGCASHIETNLKKLKGIEYCSVDYPSASGDIVFDKSALTEAEIIDVINQIGRYKVVEQDKKYDYDLIIIGGGSAAFSAAIKAESLGLSTLMVNGGLDFGGTCVNVGCVPSKHLIRAGEAAYHATHSNFKAVQPKGATVDFQQLIRDKSALVATLQQKKYLEVVEDFQHLTMLKGWATFVDEDTIEVDGKTKYKAAKFLIATGSTTNIPDIPGLKDVGFLTNVTLFDMEEKPESLTIMGAGYIGLEMAQAYHRLGVKVRIIEFTDRPLRTQTSDITDVLVRQFEKEGIELRPNYRAVRFEKNGQDIIIHCRKPDGEIIQMSEKGHLLVATGTKPNTSALGLENTTLDLTASGHIIVNDRMATNCSNIYAAGDVTNTPAYVYTAAAEGNAAIVNAFTNDEKKINYDALPWVVFTDPQIAGAGIDETMATKLGIPFEISKIELRDIPRAIAANDTRGFIKLIRNPDTDQLLGARIVAPEGGELIQQLSMAIQYGITVNDLAERFYPYLTLSEAIKLAAITFGKDVGKLSCCAS